MENEFIMPVDAALFGFKFTHAQEVRVIYQTFQTIDGSIAMSISNLVMRPSLLKELVNPATLIRECELAATHNAKTFWQEKNKHELIPA